MLDRLECFEVHDEMNSVDAIVPRCCNLFPRVQFLMHTHLIARLTRTGDAALATVAWFDGDYLICAEVLVLAWDEVLYQHTVLLTVKLLVQCL